MVQASVVLSQHTRVTDDTRAMQLQRSAENIAQNAHRPKASVLFGIPYTVKVSARAGIETVSYTDADESLVAAECLRDNDIGDSSLSLSEDRYRNEPRRPAADGSNRRHAAVSPAPVVLLPRDTDLDVAAFSNPMASKLHVQTAQLPLAC